MQLRPVEERISDGLVLLLSEHQQLERDFGQDGQDILFLLQEAAGGPKPALRIVSLHADLTNRGPTFDMDLSELEHDGQPISYAEAQQYFKRDPAHRSVCLNTFVTLILTGCQLPCSAGSAVHGA